MVMTWMRARQRHENQISCRRKEMAVKVYNAGAHFHLSLALLSPGARECMMRARVGGMNFHHFLLHLGGAK